MTSDQWKLPAGREIYHESHGQWLSARPLQVNASEASALFSASPWWSEYSLFGEKVQPTDTGERDVTLRMKRGKRLEDFLLLELGEVQPDWEVDAWDQTATVLHERVPLSCTPDALALVDRKLVLVELKTAASWMKGAWEDGMVPIHYQIQVQASLACTGLDRAFVAVLFDFGEPLRVVEVKRHQSFIDKLETRVEEFWERVTKRQAPEADGHPRTTETIARLYAEADGSGIELDPQASTWAASLAETTKQRLELDKREKELKNKLRDAMGSHTWAQAEDGSCWSCKEQTRTSIDSKQLRADHPDLAESYEKQTTFRVLRPVKQVPDEIAAEMGPGKP